MEYKLVEVTTFSGIEDKRLAGDGYSYYLAASGNCYIRGDRREQAIRAIARTAKDDDIVPVEVREIWSVENATKQKRQDSINRIKKSVVDAPRNTIPLHLVCSCLSVWNIFTDKTEAESKLKELLAGDWDGDPDPTPYLITADPQTIVKLGSEGCFLSESSPTGVFGGGFPVDDEWFTLTDV